MVVGAKKNIFWRIANLGYRTEKNDEYNSKTAITNSLIITSLALSIFLTSLFYNQQAFKLFVFEGLASIAFVLCLVFAWFKWTELSKMTALVLANVSMFGFFSSVGTTRITALVVTTLAVAPLLLFESKRLVRTIVFTILPIAAYYLLSVEEYNVFGLETLSPALTQIVSWVLFFTSAVSIVLCLVFLMRQRRNDTRIVEEKQEQFKRIAQITPNIVYIYNMDQDCVVYANDKLWELLGYDNETVKNINTQILHSLIHPDDLKIVQGRAKELLKATHDEPVETVYRIKHSKGNYIWIRNRSQVFERNKNGRVKLVLGISEDITEKVQEQEHLHEVHEFQNSILSASPYAIMSCDVHGTFTLFNRAAEEMFGYTAAEVIGKQTPAILLVPEELEAYALKLTEELGTVIEPGLDVLIQRPLMGIFEATEWTYIKKDGSRHPALLTVNALRDKQGNITGYVAISRDITVRKQHETLLKKAKEDAEEANRIKSQFLANMGHEIRTPLNAILGMTELTLEGELAAEQREYMGYVKESGENLLHVINDILDYSKIEGGVFELYPTDFNIYDIVNDAVKQEGTRAYQKNLDFHYVIDENIPAVLHGDAVRISQVLTNILGNAVKFTDRGSIFLKVTLAATDGDIAELKFHIIDTGIGIPHDKTDYIFQAFAQIDESHKRIYQGTGLGLSIARRLVEKMKGRITVESREGAGSTFTFSIKLRVSMRATENVLPNFGHIHMFAYVDSSLKKDMYTGAVAVSGINTAFVDTVEEIAKLAYTGRRNMLLVDIGEDEKILVSLAEKLNAPAYRNIYKVLAISRKIDNELKEALEDIGINILFKPVTSDILRTIAMQLPPLQAPVPQGIPIESKLLGNFTNPLRFLIVEDNDINRMLTAKVIEKMGYRVDTVVNGKQAVERFAIDPFDFIIMDIQMPEMDGMEATRHIRYIDKQRGTHTPIIAMTANAMKGDKEKYMEAGMDEYISKPFDKNILEEKINELQIKYLANRNIEVEKLHAMEKYVANGKVDLTYLEELLHGNNTAIREVLGMFITQAPQLLGEMHLAYNTGQLNHLSSLTHKLKGTLVAIGVNGQDLERLKNIERQSKEEFNTTEIKPLLDTSTNRLLSIVDDLKVYITNMEE